MIPTPSSKLMHLQRRGAGVLGAAIIVLNTSLAFAQETAAEVPAEAAPVAATAPAKDFSSELSTGIVLHIDKIKRAAGGTVMVHGSVANPTGEEADFSSVKDSRSDRIVVRLQDLNAKRQYEPVSVEGYLVGSKHNYYKIVPQGSVKFWTRVTAPPESVNEITVVFPGDGPPIDNVPIEK